jgi:hypothetical protein
MREVQYVLLYTGYAPGPRIGYTLAHFPVLNEHEMRVKGLSLSRGARTDRVLDAYAIRYIVLHKNMPDRPTQNYWKRFRDRPDLYRFTFENDEVLIVARRVS